MTEKGVFLSEEALWRSPDAAVIPEIQRWLNGETIEHRLQTVFSRDPLSPREIPVDVTVIETGSPDQL